ncbi:MAG: D-alanine--D-alanine ligase [Deltaproteobacteria bacterium]|nr:D-alanine--D-alanine ligase [Deltaproteobacteria bacterium]
MSSSRKIGVFLGGHPVERDASMRAGQAVTAALLQMGHETCSLFVDRDIDVALRQSGIDLAFLAVRGRYGGDGCLQGLLELHGIPYTGSGVLACSLTSNRAKTKEILRLCNLPVAPGYVLRSDREGTLADIHGSLGFPVVVRPVSASPLWGGTVVRDDIELEGALEDVFRIEDSALVERFLQGRPVTVGILDGCALGIVEVPRSGSWAGLRPVGTRGHDSCSPVPLLRERRDSVLRLATQAYDALGCEGAACVEMLVSERRNEIIVDIDASPLLLPASPLLQTARQAGLDYREVIAEVLSGARLRAHGRREDRRLAQVIFEGPERRASAVPEAH